MKLELLVQVSQSPPCYTVHLHVLSKFVLIEWPDSQSAHIQIASAHQTIVFTLQSHYQTHIPSHKGFKVLFRNTYGPFI